MTAAAQRSPRDDRTDAIIAAINALDEPGLDDWNAWQPLVDLSSRTRFEAVDGDPDSVVIEADGRFEAIATVYVTLIYGPSRDEESMSDEYLATVRGRIENEHVEISGIAVDTTPFYE